jgi:hypothetical protein
VQVVTADDIVSFIATQPLGVVATLGPDQQPQAALVGIAVTERYELIFDTVDSSRKLGNLRRDPRVAVVLGGRMDGAPRPIEERSDEIGWPDRIRTNPWWHQRGLAIRGAGAATHAIFASR